MSRRLSGRAMVTIEGGQIVIRDLGDLIASGAVAVREVLSSQSQPIFASSTVDFAHEYTTDAATLELCAEIAGS
jgi:hypothetical protein